MSALPLGALPDGRGGASFVVWAPTAERVDLVLVDPDGGRIPLAPQPDGTHTAVVPDVPVGARYAFRVDGSDLLPDPCSRAQPDGVHGPSQLVDLVFDWTDAGWRGPKHDELVIYELHVGTFSASGDFDGVIAELPRLRKLGVTALELMPLAAFPGDRNWGYDGVFPFAVHTHYGGARGLQQLVDAAHAHGIAVLLDVVYNHLGPEGNRLRDYGPYFTDRFATPWGEALNFDGAHSDGVRRFFIENAVDWIEQFHVDGLRLDAIHAIHDQSALPFLEELTAAVHARAALLGRRALVIGETDQNDPRYVLSRDRGGFGMDAIWCDDLHHALHVALTGEVDGYYQDFVDLELCARAWATGMAFRGEYSLFRRRRHGRDDPDLDPARIVAAAQNHDQIGNRLLGDRLTAIAGVAPQRLATLALLTSPCTPLLFMGEEHATRRPFSYFTSHADEALVEGVRAGRAREFAAFGWQAEPPDPQAVETFAACVLDSPSELDAAARAHAAWVASLLELRRTLPVGRGRSLHVDGRIVCVGRPDDDVPRVLGVFHFAGSDVRYVPPIRGGARYRLVAHTDGDGAAPADRLAAGDAMALGPWQGAIYLLDDAT